MWKQSLRCFRNRSFLAGGCPSAIISVMGAIRRSATACYSFTYSSFSQTSSSAAVALTTWAAVSCDWLPCSRARGVDCDACWLTGAAVSRPAAAERAVASPSKCRSPIRAVMSGVSEVTSVFAPGSCAGDWGMCFRALTRSSPWLDMLWPPQVPGTLACPSQLSRGRCPALRFRHCLAPDARRCSDHLQRI